MIDLFDKNSEIYISNIVANSKIIREDSYYECADGKAYEVINRAAGWLEGSLLGEIEIVKIHGTIFADPEKKKLWDQFHSGTLSWNELKAKGVGDGFDPMPSGNYLANLSGISGSRGIMGLPTHRYDLTTNKTFGDLYKMQIFLKDTPVQGVRVTITDS